VKLIPALKATATLLGLVSVVAALVISGIAYPTWFFGVVTVIAGGVCVTPVWMMLYYEFSTVERKE
jgi:hypothetical protein